jgi:VIT1/CCC1 family predicted Fe2+/Mn2+ transporter
VIPIAAVVAVIADVVAQSTPAPSPFDGSEIGCYANNPLGMVGECLLPQLVAGAGGPAMLGTLVSAAVFASLGLAGRSLAPVSVMLVLVGGVAVPMLPPAFSQLAFSIVVVSLAVAIMSIAKKYVLT